MADDQDSPEDDKPGYCKPPRKNQFQPGKSGNPRGRPRKAKSAADLFRETAKMPVRISENGRERTIATEKAVYRKLRQACLAGQAWAIKAWISLAKEHGSVEMKESLANLLDEDERLLDELRASRWRKDEDDDESE